MSKKWDIDFDEVEDAITIIKQSNESLEDFTTKYTNFIEVISQMNEAQFINKISDVSLDIVQQFDETVENGYDLIDDLEIYSENIKEIIGWTGQGRLIVDEQSATHAFKKLDKICETEIYKNNKHIDSYIDDMRSKFNQFESVDSAMDEAVKYKKEPETQSYIRQRRIEIDNDNSDFRSNVNMLEEADDIMRKLQRELDYEADR